MAKSSKIGKIIIRGGYKVTRNLGYLAFIKEFRLLEQRSASDGDIILTGLHPDFELTDAAEAPRYDLTLWDNGAYEVTRAKYPVPSTPYFDTEDESPVLRFELLPHYPPAGVSYYPHYAHKTDSGFDLVAAIPDTVVLPSHKSMIVPTGLRFQIPVGYEIQVRPRSGLAAKYGITVLNTPGTIDRGYTGEVKVILFNASDKDYAIRTGDRIAQAVLAPVTQARMLRVDSVESADGRGENGFGSTGKN